MSTVKDIEAAISRLDPSDLSELRAWFAKFDDDAWDRQIEADAKNGRLEAMYRRLMNEEGEGPLIPLDEVLDNEKLS